MPDLDRSIEVCNVALYSVTRISLRRRCSRRVGGPPLLGRFRAQFITRFACTHVDCDGGAYSRCSRMSPETSRRCFTHHTPESAHGICTTDSVDTGGLSIAQVVPTVNSRASSAIRSHHAAPTRSLRGPVCTERLSRLDLHHNSIEVVTVRAQQTQSSSRVGGDRRLLDEPSGSSCTVPPSAAPGAQLT